MENNIKVKSKPQISRFELHKRDYIFAIIFCFVSILMSFLGICAGMRVGFTVTFVMLLATTTVYLKEKPAKVKKFDVGCGVLAIICSLSFAITSSGSVRAFSFVAVLFLSLVWNGSLRYDTGSEFDIISDMLNDIVALLDDYGKSIASLFLVKGNRSKSAVKALIGVALAVPVLIVVVPLLISSDEAFSGLVTMFADNFALGIIKTAIGIFIASFVIAYCFSIKLGSRREIIKSGFKGIDNVIMISFLSVVSVCYLVYLFSQLAYFFSAFSGFLPDGYIFTFSEYARRGFFEMAIIAGINFAIITVATFFCKKEQSKNTASAIKGICTFISVFTMLIIATAISKMVLYIKEFGMTELRITTSAFMVFLSIVFISTLLKLYIGKVHVVKTAIITAAVILALLGIFNVKAVVAHYNYNAYIGGQIKEIDVDAMYELGDEGVPYLVKLAVDGNNEAKAAIKDYILSETYHSNDSKRERIYDGIGEFSVARERAYRSLENYYELQKDLPKGENLSRN